MHTLWNVNNVAVKFFGKIYTIAFVCYTASTIPIYFITCMAVQTHFQPSACEFCKRSEDFKGLKFLLLKKYYNCITFVFSKHDTVGVLQNISL